MKLNKKGLNPNIYISDGNIKLRNDAENRFLIWNLPAITTCHWATELCKKSCYARKAEIFRPTTLPCRKRNMEESEKDSFVQDMCDHIEWNLSRAVFKGKKVWFRIHESGDFYSLSYLQKWISIAQRFPKITFLAYTKAVRLVAECIEKIPFNLVLRYSVWSDTKSDELEIATKLGLPIYTAFNKKVLDKKVELEGFTKCHCDCQKCKTCYTPNTERIAVAIH